MSGSLDVQAHVQRDKATRKSEPTRSPPLDDAAVDEVRAACRARIEADDVHTLRSSVIYTVATKRP